MELEKDHISINYKKTQYKIWQPLVIDINIKRKRTYKLGIIAALYAFVFILVILLYYNHQIPGYICLLYLIPIIINFVFYKEYNYILIITLINTEERIKIKEDHLPYFQEKVAEFKVKTNT